MIRNLPILLFLLLFTASSKSVNIQALYFSPIEISKNKEEKKSMRLSPMLTVEYTDKSLKKYPLKYKTLMKMGDKIGQGVMGQITDKKGKAILKADGSDYISDQPDGNSLFHVANKDYLITHLEEQPGELYKTEIALKKGKLIALNTKPVDLSSIGGTLINCASTKTTYGSHLGGEENYALNSRYADKASPFYINCQLKGQANNNKGAFDYFCYYLEGLQAYLNEKKLNPKENYNGQNFSLYNYGYIIETQPQANAGDKVAKHYVTGRYSPELAVMMPNHKTVYMSDDGNFKGFWKFVSDKPIKNFTANWEGTLYVAKVKQKEKILNISWIKLGHANDREIKKLIDKKPKLTDIFKIQKPNKKFDCPKGFKKINEDSQTECLQLIKGKELEASFLESRKYAGYLGATLEFRKEEGLTYNPDKNVLYLAMSQIKKSMEQNYKGMEEHQDDIHLKKNPCGAVYELSLDKHYSVTKMIPLVQGKRVKKKSKYAQEWYCHPDKIANPDNISYLGHNILFISEDTKYHVNNFTWAYNTQTHTMQRIASLPIGAEITGVDKGVVQGEGIVMLNIQHPFRDNPKNRAKEFPNSSLIENATNEDLKASIGYIQGIPAEVLE